MSKRTTPTIIPTKLARTQFDSLLRQITQKNARFVITKGGEPTAVLLGVRDLDDMLEELDPAFQRSLKLGAHEHRAGKAVPLREYLKRRSVRRRAS